MTEAESIVKWARSKLGSLNWYRWDSKKGKYQNYCQGFVADAYAGGTGKARVSANTATDAERQWKVSTSKDNIPLAAAVYFSGSAGHVGIYSGNGKVIHAWGKNGVVETPLADAGKWHGWGYNGGYKPGGAVVSNSANSDSANSGKSGGTAAESNPTPVLARGSTGAAVRKLQTRLNELGYSLEVDGSFGPSTLDAVLDFQAKNGLDADGSVGPRTWEKLLGSDAVSVDSSTSSGSSDEKKGKSEEDEKPKKKDITSVVIKSVNGTSGARRYSGLRDISTGASGVELLIQNEKIYAPVVVGKMTLTRERSLSPAKLNFEVVKDEHLSFQEGDPVSLRVNGEKAFYGYVFKKERSSDNQTIKVTCYDQLRYLKNEDTIAYANKTYSQLVRMLADDYGLVCGTLEDTGYVIGSRIEEGPLFDICGNASDLTVINTGNLFVLYDDFGALTLKNIGSMKSDRLIDADTCESFSYSTSIDDNTYNKIKLGHDNDETGEREVYIVQDAETQRSWGVLQYYENNSDLTGQDLNQLGEILLKYYNQKQRKLTIRGCIGDISIRGGSLIPVVLELGDMNVSNYMLVEKVTHNFDNGHHSMDLSIAGIRGEFVA
ncbi:MAG: peptidoglycan-binding protein [Oscillospiraceae bacterium]|nr:peptidoglycan-binding protein [Oscillospiraceae bacterium]